MMKAGLFSAGSGRLPDSIRAGLIQFARASLRWGGAGLLGVAMMTAVGLARAESDQVVWHGAGGAEVKGRLTEVFGSMILVTGKDRTAFVSMATLTDDELQRVAAFLAAETALPLWKESKSRVAKDLIGRLDVVRDGKVVAYDPGPQPEPLLYLIYFSAGWCAPCHRFTPELVEAYQRLRQEAPGRIEVIFLSWDRSAAEQRDYAREAHMPWPMLRYANRGSARSVERWEGNGIPCLVAVTRSGDVVFHSFRGEEYLGPDQVLESCERLLPLLAGDTPQVRMGRHRLAVLQHVAAARGGDRPPKPYLVLLDPAKFGGITLPEMTLSLAVDERGKVREARVVGEVSHDLERLVVGAAEDWLFLPAVQEGKACARTVQMPFAVNPRPVQAKINSGS